MSANPTQEHLDKALYICCYLISTRNYSLVFDGNSGNGLIACTNSDWAGGPEDSKFTTGFYIKLANAVFLWNSHQQKTVALLSTEAEYMALSDCSRQVIWIRTCLGRLVSIYYLYQSVVTTKDAFSWETTLLQSVTQITSPSDFIILETLFKSIKWKSYILKGSTMLPICSLRSSDMSNSRDIGLNSD